MASLLLVLLSLALGLAFLQWLLPGESWFLKGAIALGLGPGVSSTLFFLSLVVFSGPSFWLMVFEGLLLVVLVVLCWRREAPPALTQGTARHSLSRLVICGVLVVLFVGFLTMALASAAYQSTEQPHGAWDGNFIWNLRARALLRAGADWKRSVTEAVPWTHPDYPLLIPGVNARVWCLVGEQQSSISALHSSFFLFAALAVLVVGVSRLRNLEQGLLMGIILLLTARYFREGMSQCADVPFSFFMLSSLILLALQERHPERYQYSFLAGLLAGLAAWTKNEGLLLIVALTVARILALWWYGGWPALKRLWSYGLGLFPMLVVIVFFKLSVAPPNDLISGQSAETLTKLMDGSRYWHITKHLANDIWTFGGGSMGLPVYVVGYVLAAGLVWRGAASLQVLLTLVVMATGYFFVYVTTPNGLDWHLKTSSTRLLVQLWPTFLLFSSLSARPINEVIDDLTLSSLFSDLFGGSQGLEDAA